MRTTRIAIGLVRADCTARRCFPAFSNVEWPHCRTSHDPQSFAVLRDVVSDTSIVAILCTRCTGIEVTNDCRDRIFHIYALTAATVQTPGSFAMWQPSAWNPQRQSDLYGAAFQSDPLDTTFGSVRCSVHDGEAFPTWTPASISISNPFIV